MHLPQYTWHWSGLLRRRTCRRLVSLSRYCSCLPAQQIERHSAAKPLDGLLGSPYHAANDVCGSVQPLRLRRPGSAVQRRFRTDLQRVLRMTETVHASCISETHVSRDSKLIQSLHTAISFSAQVQATHCRSKHSLFAQVWRTCKKIT